MTADRFSNPGQIPVSGRFAVAVGVGLAVSNLAAEQITGGIMQGPAAVFVADVVSTDGSETVQILMSADTLAALAGSMHAWSRRLPVDARDQYDALVTESSSLWTRRIGEYSEGGEQS